VSRDPGHLGLALLLVASAVGCGKYGPPVRESVPKPPQAKAGAASPQAPASTTPPPAPTPTSAPEPEPPPEGTP